MVVAYLVAGTVVGAGRLLSPRRAWFVYLAAAYLAGVLGLATEWTVNRWRRIPVDERSWSQLTVGMAEAWEYATRPVYGDQWIPLILTLGFGLGLLTAGFPQLFRRWLVGPVVVGGVVLLGCGLMGRVLAGSIYFLPPETATAKTLYVVGPAVGLGLAWIGQWLAVRRPVRGPCPDGERSIVAESGSSANDRPTVAWLGESRVYLLAILAVQMSGTLLLATSGTLSLATKSLIFAVIPVAWLMEAWLPTSRKSGCRRLAATPTLAAWVPGTAGLLVILGYFFAEVPLGLAVLWSLSLGLLPWSGPPASASRLERWGWSIFAAGPALLAAGLAAGMMVAQHV